MSNQSMPGILKVGMTERTPETRLNEANASDTWRPPTPYIIDDKADVYELADAFKYWYDIPKEERKARGLKGREYFLSEDGFYAKRMCDKMIEGMEQGFANWKPRKRYDLFKLV